MAEILTKPKVKDCTTCKNIIEVFLDETGKEKIISGYRENCRGVRRCKINFQIVWPNGLQPCKYYEGGNK